MMMNCAAAPVTPQLHEKLVTKCYIFSRVLFARGEETSAGLVDPELFKPKLKRLRSGSHL